MINVIIVDDDKDSAFSLRRNIHGQDEINVREIFNNGNDAIEYCKFNTPDLILMDINMPEISGIEASKIIKERNQNIKILFLTVFADKEYIMKAVEFNCEGFILKGHSTESIIGIIKNTYNGFNTYEKSITEVFKNQMSTGLDQTESLRILTERELSILKLIVCGKSDTQIAKELFISEGYLRNKLVEIRKKVGVKSSKELAVWGLKKGL